MQVDEKRTLSVEPAALKKPPDDSAAHGCPTYAPADGGRALGQEPLPQKTSWRWRGRRALRRARVPALVLAVGCILFVGLDLTERYWFTHLATGWRHAALTVIGVSVAGGACLLVFTLMRRQQLALSRTASDLTGILGAYLSGSGSPNRFENPHLVHCREVFACEDDGCPMHDSPGDRCWHALALRSDADPLARRVSLERCHGCKVYRASCPDTLTELGEAFNNLIFLLEQEARQRGRMRAQMAQKDKMVSVGRLASGLAHEVVNPLASISSVVQMLRRSEKSGATVDQLELIETHIQRITTTVRDLVKLGRPSETAWEYVDMIQAADEAMRLVSYDQRARDVEIVVDVPPGLPRTYSPRGQVQQLLINLSTNALDAMPSGGKLTIRAARSGGNILLEVEDTGTGIDPEAQPRVFEPFFSGKEPGVGSGLGLTVCYDIIQKHGGTIDFVSTPGKGTLFTVVLPIMEAPPDDDDRPSDNPPR